MFNDSHDHDEVRSALGVGLHGQSFVNVDFMSLEGNKYTIIDYGMQK